MNLLAHLGALLTPPVPAELDAAKRLLEEAEVSHDELRRSLQAAIKAAKGMPIPGYYCWIRDVFDDRVVYEEETPTGTTLYQQDYTVADDGTVTLASTPTKVKVATTYVAVKEAGDPTDGELIEGTVTGDVVPLVEKALRKDGTTMIRIIAPGWGSSGYYSESVLKRDGPKAFPKGTHMYWDHPTRTEAVERPERSVTELAAVTAGAPVYQENGPAGPGLYAETQVLKPYRTAIEELAPHIGVSIRASGKYAKDPVTVEGRKGKAIESLIAGESIDFVTQAGAGGKVVQLFEAARSRAGSSEEEDSVSDQELQEARTALAEAEKARDAALAEVARSNAAILLTEAREVATETIEKADVPAFVKDRLIESVAKDPSAHIKDGKLDRAAFETAITEAIKTEAAYLAKATGSGTVKGLGGSGDTTLAESETRLAAALGRGFGLSEAEQKSAIAGRSH